MLMRGSRCVTGRERIKKPRMDTGRSDARKSAVPDSAKCFVKWVSCTRSGSSKVNRGISPTRNLNCARLGVQEESNSRAGLHELPFRGSSINPDMGRLSAEQDA